MTRATLPASAARLIQLRKEANAHDRIGHLFAERKYQDELTYRTALLCDDFAALRVVLDALAREIAAETQP